MVPNIDLQNSGYHLQLHSRVDLEHLRQLAEKKTEWSQLTRRIVEVAQAKLTYLVHVFVLNSL